MVFLFRSPEPTASWSWVLEQRELTVEYSSSLAVQVSESLQRQGIFGLEISKVSWVDPDGFDVGFQTEVLSPQRLSPEELAQRVRDSWPAGRQEVQPSIVELFGGGNWFNQKGQFKGDPALIDAVLRIEKSQMILRLKIYHDIWTENNFFGNPHPQVCEQNAPRLAAGLQTVEDALGAPATPGQPTFFGTPYNYGVRVHKAEDGSGIDVSDHL